MSPGLWSRLRHARLVQVLLIYLGASWVTLEVADVFIDKFGLPAWFFQAAILLLLIGLLIVVATSVAQARPASALSDPELPAPWEVDLVDLKEAVVRGRVPHLTWARVIVGGLFAFSLLFGFAGLYVLLTDRQPPPPRAGSAAAAAPGIAVLPFRTVGAEMELWREGMVDLLATNLDGAGGLRTIDPRTVLSAWRRLAGDGNEGIDLPLALQVGRAVSANYTVLGSAVGSSGGVRLSAEVYDASSGALQGRTQVEGSPDSMFALVDALSLEVLRAGLVSDPASLPEFALKGLTTSSLPGLKAYLAGEQKFRRSKFRDAIADFTRAVEADSTFALALYRISQAYGWIESFSERTTEYGDRAARFADRLPKRERLMLEGNHQLDQFSVSAIGTLREMTDLYPDDAEAWQLLGEAYWHIGEMGLHPRERHREAFRQALELDPGFGPVYIHLIDDALVRRDSAEARELIARHRSIDPTSPHATGLNLVWDLAWGDSASRLEARAALDTASADVLFTAFARLWWSGAHNGEALLAVGDALWDARFPPTLREFAFWAKMRGHAVAGQIREANAAGEAIARELGSEWLTRVARWYVIGSHLVLYPDPAGADAAAQAMAADPEPGSRFLIGALAASEGRWEDVEEKASAFESAAGGGAEATQGKAYALALRGYADLRRGNRRRAADRLEEALTAISHIAIHAILRYELGRLWLALGEPREAERYLKTLDVYSQGSAMLSSPVDYYLGEVYESLEDKETATLYYARFVRLWERCDPEFRPLWERGQRALERLTAEARG